MLALIFALIYQQIENRTIEPKISADAVDMHPAVAFAAVILGAALFGVAGALVAVPIAALLLSLLDKIYSRDVRRRSRSSDPASRTATRPRRRGRARRG